MGKMSVADAAEFFGVSKEAIHNRIRRGSLKSEIIDSVKYVIIDGKQTNSKTSKRTNANKTNRSHIDSKYFEFLEEQNEKLQAKVEKLENETRSLRDQKEQLLIDEREKIENIYKEKDEQLKNIINMISSNLMLDSKPKTHEHKSLDAEIETVEIHSEPEENWTSLNKFLKSHDYKKADRKKIVKDFTKKAKKGDKTIHLDDGKCYIDPVRFVYDL